MGGHLAHPFITVFLMDHSPMDWWALEEFQANQEPNCPYNPPATENSPNP